MMSGLISYIKEQDAKFIFLALLLIVLPSFESPKNIFSLLFVISWVLIAKKNQDWGGRWRLIDTIFLLWMAADIIVGINAVVTHNMPAKGSADLIRFILVGWAISRSRFTMQQIIVLCVTAIVFSVVPLLYSYWNCNGGSCVELNSVGHVNHTAIYLSIVYAVSLSLLVFNFQTLGNLLKIVLAIAIVILAYVIVDTNSRAASGLFLIVSLMAMAYAVYYYQNQYSIVISISSLMLLSAVLFYNPPPVVNKFIKGSPLIGSSIRQGIRNFSYYAFKANPILGVGFGNFANLDHNDIEKVVIKDKGVYNKNKYRPFAHPHNVYYTYLVSGGIVIFTIFSWFWLQIVRIVFQVYKYSGEKWLVFSATSVVMINLGIGWVNTTLAAEHALLSMFVLGLLIAKSRERD